MGKRAWGGVVLAAAAALAGAGGSVAGLGAPAWLAGAVVAVSALVAGLMADRSWGAREARAAARERRGLVLDELREPVPPGRSDVLGLLQAGRSPMPFRGRTRELERLAAWRDDRAGCPVLVIGGPGGVGKSRLALEFGLRVPPGWAAGWLHVGAGSTAVDAIGACGDPALVLVEDADGREDLAPLLESLAGRPAEPLIRVILVTRSPEGLRAALGRRLEERHAWIAADAAVLDLEAAGGPGDWERWYDEAVAAFAAALGRPAPAVPGRFIQDPGPMAYPFVVLQAQALLAVLGTGDEDHDPRDLSFGQVAAALMGHEQRWWHAVAARWDWGGGGPPALDVQEHCVTALALLGAEDAAEAGQVLRRVPELGDAPAERLSAIASWALALYPAEGSLGPRIRPDLIGDWFVVTQLAADPGLADSLRGELSDEQAGRALALLARAADTSAEAGRLFGEFAADDIRRSILAAALAARTGRAGRRLLDAVIAAQLPQAGQWTPAQLDEITRLIPEHFLLRTHVALATLAVNAYRQLAADNPAAHQANLARALNSLGNWLGLVGRYPDALQATEESVALNRQLAADDPAAHQAHLAMALNNLGNGLDRVGRYPDALQAAEESVALRRQLAADNPAAHQASLALGLDSLGVRLGRVGRYPDALQATEESVALRRQLAADNPAAHQADLAMALNNLGGGLDKVGRYQDALQAAEESVALRRQLAADNPAAHQAHLAMALTNLGNGLDKVGRYQDALQAAEESVALRRQLAADNPAAHQADLAMALNNLGNRLDKVGRYQDALQAAEESVALNRQLAADNPAAHQAHLALALTNLGNRLGRVGRYPDALQAAEESVALRRQLAADNPAAHQADLALALNNLGNGLDRVGRYQDALQAAEESVALNRQLAADDPAAHQAHLAMALTSLGNFLAEAGSDQEMLAARTEAVRIYRELATRDPDLYEAEYRRQLGALLRDYDQRGMSSEAITHDLPPGKSQPPGTSI